MTLLSRRCATGLFFFLALDSAAPAAFAQLDGAYDYQLNFELDPRTGRYRPAYSYDSSRGSSTIWLDRESKRGGRKKADRARDGRNDERLLISCTWPARWKVNKSADKAEAVHPDGSRFTVFASRPPSGQDRRSDFVQEWKSRASSNYGSIAEGDIRTGDLGGGTTYSLYTKADPRGVALAIIYTGGRALPLMIEFPDQQSFERHGRELTEFIKSFEIKRGKIDMPK